MSEHSQEVFSLAPTTGPAKFFRARIFPFVPFGSLLALSAGSGITTYMGMLNFATDLVALCLTVGIQSFMFVFAVWMSLVESLRNGRGVLIAAGYILAASVSVFFSFAAFYNIINDPAAERQSSNLAIRNAWSNIYSRISNEKQRSILSTGSSIISDNSYREFVTVTNQATQRYNEALNAITVAFQNIQAEIDSKKQLRLATVSDLKTQITGINRQIQQQESDVTRLRARLAQLDNEVPQASEAKVDIEALGSVEAMLAADGPLTTHKETHQELATDLAKKRIELAAKQQQMAFEAADGGTVRDDGSVSAGGEGPLFRQYRDEAIVIEADVVQLESQVAAAKREIATREQDVKNERAQKIANAQAESAAKQRENDRVEASVQAQKNSFSDQIIAAQAKIEKLNKEIVKIREEQAVATSTTQFEQDNADYDAFLNTTAALKDNLSLARETPIVNDLKDVNEVSSVFTGLEAAFAACIEGRNNQSLIQSWLARIPGAALRRPISFEDIRCPAIPAQEAAGQTLVAQMEDLKSFNETCAPSKLPRPKVLEDVAKDPTLDGVQKEQLTKLIESSRASGADAATARNEAEAIRYFLDYNEVRNKITDCMGIVSLDPDGPLSFVQQEITTLLNSYNPDAHSFTRTIAAFQRNDYKATVAIILAVAVDVLIVVFGLGSRNTLTRGNTPNTPWTPHPQFSDPALDSRQLTAIRDLVQSAPDLLNHIVNMADKIFDYKNGTHHYQLSLKNNNMIAYTVHINRLVAMDIVSYTNVNEAIKFSEDTMKQFKEIFDRSPEGFNV